MRVTEMFCSDRETTAASVLSQMSKIQQSPLEAIETQSNMSVAHQCDVETTASASSSQEILSVSVGSIADNEEHENELDERMNTESTNSTLGLASDDHQTKLQTTLEVSSTKVFPCEYCGKVFNKSYNLKTHHRVHTGERPFPCVICGHRFANLGDLKRHNRTHTGEKPFTCEFCDKAFSDFGSHKRHLRLHTGFKPFKCEQCDRQFTRLDSFKNHTRLHTGERPYKCEECQKQFNYLTTYKRHLNIHSGERPYTCDLCHKTFTRLTYLRNHKLNHGKLTAKSQSDKRANEQETSSAGMDTSEHPSMIMKITSDSNESKEKTDDDDHVIHHVAQVLSEGGVHVSVTTVVDGSGNSQPVLIKTPGTDSQEATSHALIFTQDLLNASSANDNPQLLTFTSDDNNEEAEVTKNDDSSEGKSETRQLFLAQPLFKSDQDFTTECQLISPSFDGVMSVTQRAGDIVSELNEETTQVTNKSEPTEGTAIEVSSEDPDVSNSSNISCNAVYIAIDPTQTSVQQILGELHVAVNPESLTKET